MSKVFLRTRQNNRRHRRGHRSTENPCRASSNDRQHRGPSRTDVEREMYGRDRWSRWDGRRARGREHHNQHNQRIRKMPSETPPSAEDDASLELPGFYYDKEKKKYFKILPNHNSSAQGSITNAVIKGIHTEKKRQKDIKDLWGQSSTKSLSSTKRTAVIGSVSTSRQRSFQSSNLYHVITNYHYGLQTPFSTQENIQKLLVKKWRPRGKSKVQIPRTPHHTELESCSGLLMSPDGSLIYGAWTPSNSLGSLHFPVKFKPIHFTDSPESIAVQHKPLERSILTASVSSMCWVTSSNDGASHHDNSSKILVTTLPSCYSQQRGSEALVRILDICSQRDVKEFSVGTTCAWTSAWNSQAELFSVGTNKGSLLVDVATRKMWEFDTDKLPVFAQTFSRETGHVLYSGTHHGSIFMHDLRSRSTRSFSRFSHKTTISHVYQSLDDCYLLASDISGKIRRWDLRQRRVVQEYLGHVNEYVRRPFHISDSENLLAAVGEDCYTRLWCYQTGELLHTLPSPCAVSVDDIPRIALSDHLGGPSGLPGVLMAVKNHFYVYTV